MSLFAFHVEGKRLHALADELAVRALCPLAEVRAEQWLFFAADGSPLRPQFSRGQSGSAVEGYYLRPWASCGSCSLPQVLPFVETVVGPPSRAELTARFAPAIESPSGA